jgi:hypothetical protein
MVFSGVNAYIEGNSKKARVICCISLFIFIFSITFYILGNVKEKSSSWEYSEESYAIENIVALSDNNMISGGKI